jgi:O-antigen/teichoic acid export membrane protein
MRKLITAGRQTCAMLKRSLPKIVFSRPLATLISGSMAAQLIGVLSILILARVYTPKDFAVFAFVLALSMVLSLAGTATYEQAAHIAENEEQAAQPVAVALIVLSGATLTFTLAATITEPIWKPRIAGIDLTHPTIFIAASMLTGGAITAVTAYAIQQREFATVSLARFVQALVAAGTSLTAGLAGTGGIGLLIGLLFGQVAYLGIMIAGTRLIRRLLEQNRRDLVDVAKKQFRFPLLTLPGLLINSLSHQFITLATPSTFGPETLGQYNLGQRASALPISIIGGSIGEVFRSSVSPQYVDRSDVPKLFYRTATQLAVFGLAFCLPLLLAGPQIFQLIFGSRWYQAGEIVQILSPLIFARLVISPLSTVLYLTGRHAFDTLLHTLFLASSLLAFWVGLQANSFLTVIVWVSILHTTIYAAFFVVCWQTTKLYAK